MNILYIVDPGVVGGATHSFIELVNNVKKNGHTPIVCTSKWSTLNEQLNSIGIKTYEIGHASMMEPVSPYKWKRPIKYPLRWLNYMIRRYISIKRIEKKVDLTKISLIHTNSARNDIGCFLNKKYNIPHIMHFREFGDNDFDCIFYNHKFKELYNRYTNKFIAISEAVKTHWISKGLNSQKFTVIYNGINYQDIQKSEDKDKKNEHLNIVMTSGICKAKGQHLAIKAISLLPKFIKDRVSLDIIGWADPLYIKELNKMITDLSLSNNVKIYGASKEIHKLLGNYQIGLMCSRAEGFGRVTAEYMHAKMGIIASDSGANLELITNKHDGLIFKSGDESSLAQCICKFYEDRELLYQCSINAQKKAISLYTDELNAMKIRKIYDSVLIDYIQTNSASIAN